MTSRLAIAEPMPPVDAVTRSRSFPLRHIGLMCRRNYPGGAAHELHSWGGASHHQRATRPVPEPFASIYRSSLAANLFERQVGTVVLKLANYPYLHLIVLENP
jgi:hypothetical protein